MVIRETIVKVLRGRFVRDKFICRKYQNTHTHTHTQIHSALTWPLMNSLRLTIIMLIFTTLFVHADRRLLHLRTMVVWNLGDAHFMPAMAITGHMQIRRADPVTATNIGREREFCDQFARTSPRKMLANEGCGIYICRHIWNVNNIYLKNSFCLHEDIRTRWTTWLCKPKLQWRSVETSWVETVSHHHTTDLLHFCIILWT